MNELQAKPKSKAAQGRIQGQSTLGRESEAKACMESPVQRSFGRQRNQMEHLLSSLQELENRLSTVLMSSAMCSLKRECDEDVSYGSSAIVSEIEKTTVRLEEYTDKVNTIISMLEI